MVIARDPMVPPEKIRPLRRVEYDRLVSLGMLHGEHLELLFGRLVRMSPQGGAHVYAVTELARLLVPAIGRRANVRVQAPFIASEDSEPEPDVAIVPPGDYLDEHPHRAHLLVEVAESSLQDDRRIKAPLYAAASVPEYWIVDVAAGCIEVYRDPREGAYASVTRHGREVTLVVPGFEDVRVPVAEVVPPR
jgi:Uma2 family endonuclease